MHRIADGRFGVGQIQPRPFVPFPHHVGEPLRFPLGQSTVSVGRDHHRAADVGNIVVLIASGDACGQDPRLALQFNARLGDRLERLFVSILKSQVPQHRRLYQSLHRMDLARKNPAHQPGRMNAALAHVEMRALLISDQHIGQLDNLRRNVAVEIVRQDERNLAAEGGSHAARDLFIGLREVFRVHGAVQGQQDAAHLRDRPEPLDQPRAQRFEGFLRNGSLGSRDRMNRGHDIVPGGGRALDETSRFRVADRP